MLGRWHRSSRRRSVATVASVALLLACSTHAQPAPGTPPAGAAATAAPEAPAFDEGLLFRVEPPRPVGTEAVAPSHVFGTIHLGGPELGIPDEARARLMASDRYCMEMVPDAATLVGMFNRMFLPEARSLPEILGDDLWQQVGPTLSATGLGPFAPRLQPWAAWMLLSVPEDAGLDAMDLRLLGEAQAANKGICQLESADEQIDAVAGLTEADQVTLLRLAARERADLPAQMEKAVAAYKARDLGGMMELETDAADLAPAERAATERLMARLLDERNVTMVARMRPWIDGGGVFVAIGAAHLGGSDGVLARLARAGYTVSREQ